MRRLFAILILLLIAPLSFYTAAPLQRAQAGFLQTTLASDPPALSATLALGEQQDVNITITNTSASELVPVIREAYTSPPATTFTQPPAAQRVPLPTQSNRVDPQIASAQAAAVDGSTEMVIFLNDQADLAPAYRIASWKARGEYVYQTLRDHANRSQQNLRAWLSARGVSYRSFWVVNALAVRGDAQLREALAARGDVAMLRANRVASLSLQPPPAVHRSSAPQAIGSCDVDANNICWNIRSINAERTWKELGIQGQGITVANLDSGVRYDHPALIDNYRGNLGNGTIDHNYNWVDLYSTSLIPKDASDHGTHTMGTMVAKGVSADQPAVGVAPQARWIAARSCDAIYCYELDLISAAEWMLAPRDLQGNNPRPDLRPHVINNSWADGSGGKTWYAGYTAAWRAAGIFPVFAIGNGGNYNGCGSAESPGDYRDVVGVGAVGKDGRLTTFSTIGPTTDGRVKPDLTAPGSGIASTGAGTTAPNGLSYVTKQGTSMAAPHVAGAVALLWSADPGLIGDYETTYNALTASANPIIDDSRFLNSTYANCQPTGVPNNIYGHGSLNTYAAARRVTIDVPWLELTSAALTAIAPGNSSSLTFRLDAQNVPGPGTYQARILVYGEIGEPPLEIPVTMVVPDDPQYAVIAGRVTGVDTGLAVAATITVAGGPTLQADTAGAYRLFRPGVTANYTLTVSASGYVNRVIVAQAVPGITTTVDIALSLDLPRLSVNETEFEVELPYLGYQDLPLELTNEGTEPLSYTAQVIAGAYGVWRSSDLGGPPANWIAPPADAVTLTLADDAFTPAIPLGFDFSFYNRVYEFVYIGSNGMVSMGLPSASSSFLETCMPLRETSGAALAPLHVDLDPEQGGRISYARLEQGFLVSYENVPLHQDPTRTMSFQALLTPDGRVQFNYRSLAALRNGDSATAGIQRTSADAQSLGCKETLTITNELTIDYLAQPAAEQMLQVDRPAAHIAEGQTLTVNLRASWVDSPLRRPLLATVLLTSSDPQQPATYVRVRLINRPAPYRLHLTLISRQ
jgi:subtilisin family serine protease